MELNKQLVGLLFGLGVLLFLWFKFRNPYTGKKDRRKEQRRSGVKERRLSEGRRKQNQLKHESQLEDRRKERPERRIGEKNRRHKKRRKADNIR